MKWEGEVVAATFTQMASNGAVTLAGVSGSPGTVELTVPASHRQTYHMGRRVTVQVIPR